MDIIAFNEAATANERIEKIVANPDSVAGLVSVQNLVPTGETITIPAGRTVVHPNLQVDGTLEIDGTLFIPSGGSVSTTEVDATVVKQDGNVVANDSAVVHKTGDETIAGIKTFSSSPIAPTPTLADNSTKVATTAFVNAEISGDVGVANSSLVKTALNATGTAPIYACRAWVNFNGTGAVAIRASGNVSSITDNGVGNYNINFTTAMSDVNYTVVGSVNHINPSDNVVSAAGMLLLHGNGSGGLPLAPTVSSVRVGPSNHGSGGCDSHYVNVAIFR